MFLEAHLVTILNGLAYGVLLYILAVGLTLVFGMMNILNLAHGSIFLLGAYLASVAMKPGVGLTALAIAVCAAFLAGSLYGAGLFGLTIPVRSLGHLAEALVTLGVALIAGATYLWMFGTEYYSVSTPTELAGSVSIAGQVYPLYRLALIGFGVALAVAVELIIERTQVGALIRATVADGQMVKAIGVNTSVLLVVVFAVGGGLAAIGGVLGGPILGAGPGLDGRVLLLGLVVVVIGGLGSTRGSLIGAILIGQIQTLGTALIPALAPFLLFGAMALVLAIRPRGFLGLPVESH
jgi:branched-chain amino acid transport system permease protein